jgi:hypothetical protein
MNFSNFNDLQQTSVPKVNQPTVAYSISRHYHHSAHIVAAPPSEDSMSAVSSMSQEQDARQVLLQNHIDPSTLLSAQMTLFECANAEQRSRLIELWKISPPEMVRADGLGGWQTTTLDQEEEIARIRHQRKLDQAQGEQMQSQGNDEDWRDQSQQNLGHSEPYIDYGYQLLAERDYNDQVQKAEEAKNQYSPLGSAVGGASQTSTDPVYQGRHWWRDFHGVHGQREEMENQYGMFDQSNHFRATNETNSTTAIHGDEEML